MQSRGTLSWPQGVLLCITLRTCYTIPEILIFHYDKYRSVFVFSHLFILKTLASTFLKLKNSALLIHSISFFAGEESTGTKCLTFKQNNCIFLLQSISTFRLKCNIILQPVQKFYFPNLPPVYWAANVKLSQTFQLKSKIKSRKCFFLLSIPLYHLMVP